MEKTYQAHFQNGRGKTGGRVLKVKMGVNPNSSSLGTDLQVILFGVTALGLLTTVLSTAIRLWFKPKTEQSKVEDEQQK